MASTNTFLHTSLPYLLVVLLCSFIVSVQEFSQIALKKFKYPFVIRYINSIEQLLLCPIIPIWRKWKHYYISRSHMNNSSINSQKRDHKINIIKPDIDMDDKHFYWFIFYTVLGSLTTSSAGMILNIGLDHITVPTAVALSSFRTVFILILSVMFLSYPLKLWSISAVIVSCLGVLLYVMEIKNNDTNDGDHTDTIYGISCCLIAQLLFAMNDIICKKAANYCYDTNRIVMGNILYTIYTSLFALPLFIWVIWYPQNITNNLSLDYETLVWILMAGISLCGVHVVGYVTITLKSPIWTAMGFLLATPMSFIVDVILHNYKPSYLCILGGMLLLLGFFMLEVLKPSQILCPFCDKILANQADDIEDIDWDYEGSKDFERKCKLTNSLSDEYGYKYKKDNNGIGKNENNNNSSGNKKYNSGNSSDDIEPMLSALLQSGGTYTSTMPSEVGNNYTTEDIADISFNVDENDHISE